MSHDNSEINSTVSTSDDSEPSKPVTLVAVVSSFVLCFQIFVIVRFYIKNKENFYPENLFEINVLTDIFVTTLIFTCFLPFEDFFSTSGFPSFCVIVNFLLYFSKFSLFVDICLYQNDRYLYIKLKSSYKVSPENAKDKIMSTKIIILIFTCLVVILDKDIMNCGKDEFFVCTEMKNDNIYWFTIPMCICLGYIIFVIWYAVKVIIIEQTRMNLSLSKQNKISTISTTPPSTLEENKNAVNEEDIVIEDIEYGEKEHIGIEIIRRTSDPNVFHRINPSEIPEPDSPRFLVLLNLTVVKKILQFNIRGLCIIVCLFPQSILYIYVYITSKSCSDSPNLLIAAVISKLLLLFPIIVLFIFAYIRK